MHDLCVILKISTIDAHTANVSMTKIHMQIVCQLVCLDHFVMTVDTTHSPSKGSPTHEGKECAPILELNTSSYVKMMVK